MNLCLTVALSASLAFTAFGGQAKKTNQSKNTSTRAAGPTITSFTPSVKTLATCADTVYPIVNVPSCSTNKRRTVTLEVVAVGEPNKTLTYNYSTTSGEIIGEGARVTWSFGQANGEHTATVIVRDSQGRVAKASTTVVHTTCTSCFMPDPPCPIISVKAWDDVAHRAERAVFEVNVPSGHFLDRPDYVWTVTGGKILRGQHTPILQVIVTGDIDTSVTATVEVSGIDASCTGRAASRSLSIQP